MVKKLEVRESKMLDLRVSNEDVLFLIMRNIYNEVDRQLNNAEWVRLRAQQYNGSGKHSRDVRQTEA